MGTQGIYQGTEDSEGRFRGIHWDTEGQDFESPPK